MKKTIALLAAATALFTGACNKSEILSPTDQRHIYMSYPESDNPVFNFSFVSTNKPSVRIAIPIKFAGRPLTEDLAYAVSVDPASTLTEGTEYQFPELVFHKGDFVDTIFVTLHRTKRMESAVYNLKFTLTDNANFRATHRGMLEADLRVTAQIAQPAWWNQDVTTFYLGKYSNKKFELFSQEIFMGDYGELDDSAKRFYALKFKYWLELNETFDEDDSRMTVAIQG